MTDTDAAIITALIVAVPTVLTSVVVPIIMFWLTGRQKRIDLEFQYRREDELARRVARTAEKQADDLKNTRDQSRVNTSILVAQNDTLATIKETVTAIKENGNGTKDKNGH